MNPESSTSSEKLIYMLKYVFPEMEELLPIRFNILNAIKNRQPVGRRMLSGTLGYTERLVRRECDILKDCYLIDYYSDGMRITEQGLDTLQTLSETFYQMSGLSQLENDLTQALGIKKILIGSIGPYREHATLTEVGSCAAKYLHEIIQPKTIIGLTGGSSIEKVISGYKEDWVQQDYSEVTVVPARGGLGNKSEHQANTLAERLSDKLNASYQLLYTQDNLSKSTIEGLKSEPSIQRILKYIQDLDVLVFGVGKASVMANRRVLEQEEIDYILGKGAVAESFGYYFNKSGEIVHEISTIGIDLQKYKTLENVIAVAAGVDKVEAIVAVSKLNSNLVLVTDEQTAKSIQLYLMKEEQKND